MRYLTDNHTANIAIRRLSAKFFKKNLGNIEMGKRHNSNITKGSLAALRPGGQIVQQCESIAEFQAAYAYAWKIRRENPRGDGYDYRISARSAQGTVSVSLRREREE